jgi:N-acetylmuramoyl-L-alanine amidase
MNKPEVIIIHHTGGTNANPLADTSNQTFDIIKNYHIGLGWGDIGYNWIIDKAGKIWQGRDEKIDGCHTIGMNTKSIGICLIGNFDLTYPTIAQEIALKTVYCDLVSRYPILQGKVYPHRKYANKSCYGKNLADDWALNIVEPKVEEVHDVVWFIKLLKKLGIIK